MPALDMAAELGIAGLQDRIMPKIKTNRSAAKRFRTTASGKVRRQKAFSSHILTKKNRKRKRRLRKLGLASNDDLGRIRKLLPYS